MFLLYIDDGQEDVCKAKKNGDAFTNGKSFIQKYNSKLELESGTLEYKWHSIALPVKVHVHASSQIPIWRCQFTVRVQLKVEWNFEQIV